MSQVGAWPPARPARGPAGRRSSRLAGRAGAGEEGIDDASSRTHADLEIFAGELQRPGFGRVPARWIAAAYSSRWRRRTPLGVPDALVGEKGDVAIDRLGAYEPHGFLVAGLAEEALAGAEHDWVDLQAQLVDEIVLHQRAYELEAGPDNDFAV